MPDVATNLDTTADERVEMLPAEFNASGRAERGSTEPYQADPPRITLEIFDLRGNSWSSAEWPEGTSLYDPIWIGDELIFPTAKQRYDLETKRFRPMAKQMEREIMGPAVWADGALVQSESAHIQTPEAWAWDPSSDRWFKLPKTMRSLGGPLIWTGRDLLKVGSYDFTDLQEKDEVLRFGP